EGFVGGVCAQSSVRLHAARALETGEAILLRLFPGVEPADAPATPDRVVVAHNPCLSGGAPGGFPEPPRGARRLAAVLGAIAELARAAGYEVGAESGDGDAALVVASHGEGEEDVLAAALHAGVPYVALVASPRRGSAVRDSLDVPEALRERLHTPAGLDI